MNRLHCCLVLCMTLVSGPAWAAFEQTQPDAAGHLIKVVVLSRHGVRSPTQSSKTLLDWSQSVWPEWPVGRGELTPRGAELVTALWQHQRERFTTQGLFPDRTCPDPESVFVRADPEQRTRATAKALLEGLAPGCGLSFVTEETLQPDPLFHPVEAGVCALNPSAVDLQSEREALERRLENPIRELAELSGPCAPDFCRRHGLAAGCTAADIPSRLSFHDNNHKIDLGGRLGIAASLVEILLLEYAQWPDKLPGFGPRHPVDRRLLERLLPIHSRVFALVNQNPSIAAHRGSALLAEMTAALAGVHPDPALNAAGLVAFVGHDTNIAAVTGLLGLRWHLPGYGEQEIPPASMLVLELWEQNGIPTVRASIFAQSLDTLRSPTGEGEPLRQSVVIPDCIGQTDGKADAQWCTLNDFRALVSRKALPACIPLESPLSVPEE